MNRKAKKRLSILKKAASSEESSPTFTKINRRISFSGKKSIKEFTSDDNKMTIWGNSYEESAEMIQSASHHTLAADSTISQSISQTTQCSKNYSESVDKENEQINLRSRRVLKRKSNVLKAISVQPATNPKDVTPNMETIEMDISINDSDNKSQKGISVGKLASPNLTPVPPQKISKLNEKVEELCTINYSGGRRISDELFSEANFSIPSRILERGDVNLTYGFNLSEFDILQTLPHRPSENITSFATKIDRLNFSNEDEPHNEDNSVMLKIQNPQIEQMRITGSIVTATNQNLDISVEINDGSKVFDNVRQSIPTKLKETEVAEPPPTPESPKANPVLEMFKIRNELKKQMAKQFEEKLEKENIVPFTPAKFETLSMPNFNSTNRDTNLSELGSNQHIIVFSNKEMGLTKINENKNRETILFAKDNADLDMSLSEEDIDSVPKSKRATIHFKNDNLESSIICEPESTVQDTTHFVKQEPEISLFNKSHNKPHDINGSSRFVDEIKKVKDTSRGTIYFPKEAELETSLDENYDFTVNEKNARQKKRATIHYPNQELEMTAIETAQNIKTESTNLNITEMETAIEQLEIRAKRDTIHFTNQRLEISTIESNTNVKDDNINRNLKIQDKLDEKFKRQVKKGTIHFPSQELEFSSMIESSPNKKDENETDATKVSEKRGTIHFANHNLETSIVDESENLIHTEEAPKFSEKHKAKIQRGTIHFSNQELEMSTCVDGKPAEKYDGQTKRGTINFQNQELETSVFVVPVNQKVKECEERTKRGTIHFPSQQLEMTSVEPSPKLHRKQTKRDTINFLNQDLEFSLIEICPTENGKNQQNPIIRGTIHFPNHDLETSLANDSVKENIQSTDDPKYHEEKATEAKRGTFHFPNQSLEMSLVESNPNLKEEDINESLQVKESMIQLCSIENGREQNKQEQDSIHFSIDKKLSLTDAAQQIKRGTVYFTNQELETSMINLVTQARNLKVAPKMSARQETQTKRGTIHFPNQQLDMSIVEPRPNEKDEKKCEKPTNRGTIHFPKQELDLSTVESVSNVKGLNKNLNTKETRKASKMQEKSIKRETVHFENQELDTSLTIESVMVPKVHPESKTHSNRGTIHYPNQHLEVSMDDPGLNESKQDKIQIGNKLEKQSKRETINFPNQELDISIFEYGNQTSNLEKAKHETETYRSSIHFHNQQLDMSTVELHQYEKGGKKCEKLTNRGTIHFPKQELDLSTAESILNVKGQNKNLNTKETRNASKIQEKSIKRETVHFENQELDTSLIIESVVVPEVHPERKTHSNRGTIHYPNQHLEVSMDDPGLNESKQDKIQIGNKLEKQSKRETINFPNQELDTLIFEYENQTSNLEKAKHETETYRSSIHFPNQQLDMSTVELHQYEKGGKKCEKLTNRGTIHFPKQELDLSTAESILNVKGQNKNLNTKETRNASKIQEKSIKRETVHFENQELDTSLIIESVVVPEVHPERKTHSNRGTIHYPNQHLEVSMDDPGLNESKQDKIQIGNKLEKQSKRETINFPNQELDISIFEYGNQTSNLEKAKHETETYRSSIHFPNQQLDMSTVELHQYEKGGKKCEKLTNRGTIHFPKQELDLSTAESILNVKGQNKNLNTKETRNASKIQEKLIKRETVHFENQELDTSLIIESVVVPEVHPERKTHSNRGTIHYPNQHLEVYMDDSGPNELKRGTVQIDNKWEKQTNRETIHFPNQELDTSIFEHKNQTSNMENAKHETETKRGTIHFPNQQLEMSTVESHRNAKENKNLKSLEGYKISENSERQKQRATIYFSNKELEISKMKEEHEANVKVELTTKESASNVKGWNRNLNLTRATNTIKRDTIHFANQEIDSSLVVVSCENDKRHKSQSNRGTIHFPNEQLEISNFEPSPNMKVAHRNLNLIVAAKINEKCERKTKRGTLHFPNQELEMSTIVSYSNPQSEDRNPDVAAALSETLKGSTKRGTVLQSQEVENSIVVESKALTAVNSDTNTTRKTIYFHTQEALDRSLADLHLQDTSENEQIKTKMANRATTYFVNESLDASMEEVKQIKPKNSSHRTIHCDNENDFDISIQEPTATDFDMSATENNLDSSMERKIYARTPLPCSKFEISDARELRIQPQPLIPGTIYYEDKTLDLSEFEIKSRHTLYLDDEDEEDEDDLNNIDMEPKIESIKQPSRSTIYFPNQRLDTSKTGDAEQMDTSTKESIRDKNLLRDTIHYVSDDLETTQLSENPNKNNNNMGTVPKSVIPVNALKEDTHEYNRHTIHYENQELENTLPMDSENANVKHLKHKESEIEKNRATIHFRGTDLNDLDISAQPILSIDHSEAKCLRPISERFQSRIKELEEKIWGQRRSVNVSINLDSEEMDLSSYEKPDEQLDNDLSGLKISGQDSTDFENNTQALCNLDPKHIYCESKYDAMNATTPDTDQPNISTCKLADETMLHDLVPRSGNKTFQELLEITAHLPEQKTRKEICNDYINLTLSRFSHSFANSSKIDETSLQLVNSLDDLEEVVEAKMESNISSDHGIRYVKIEDVNLIDQNVDEILTRKKTRRVPVLDLTKCQELLNQPSFSEIANEYKLKNLIDSKRVSELHQPMMGPEKPSLRFLMNNCREQMMKELSEKNRIEYGIAPFLPLTPKITKLLQNKLAERTNYWTCHDNLYNHGIIVFTHHRVPCIKIKMLFNFFEETEFGEFDFYSVIPMMSKTKIIASTFELIQHLQFFKNVPSDMKNMCRRSNEILDFLENLDAKIITKNYENVQKLKEIVVSTNSKIWHENDTGQYGITKFIIHKRNIYDIIIKISDLQITDISDVTVKPKVRPTNKVKDLTRGLDFLQKLLEKPRDYFNFDK